MKRISKRNKSWTLLMQPKLIKKKRKDKRRRREKKKNKIYEKIYENNLRTYKSHLPPKNFSLLENTNKIINYFNLYGKDANKGFSLDFDLSSIDNLSFDGVALLTAKIKDKIFRKKSIIRGKNPSDKNMRKLFLDTGFFEHIGNMNTNHSKIGKMIHNITNKKVRSDDAGSTTEKIIQHTGVKGIIRQRIYETIVECMSNTQEHAGQGHDRWLMYYNTEDIHGKKVTQVCFIDLGIGILKSINTNIKDKERYEKRIDIKKLLTYHTKEEDIFRALMEGNINELSKTTKTGKQQRGQGLPTLKKFSQEDEVNKFLIVSNNIYADIKNNKYTSLDEDFHGTFIYREIENK